MGPCMREVRTWEQKKHSHKQLAMAISQHKWIVPHTTTCHPPSSYLRLKYQFTPKSSISLSKHEMNLCYCARTLSFSSKPQGPAAAVGVVGAGNARAVTPPGPELLAPHPAKEAPCWLCCCLSGVTLARGVGLRWRHFLLGRRSHRADLHHPTSTSHGCAAPGACIR